MQRATLCQLAINTNVLPDQMSHIAYDVVERVRGCLQRAYHPKANEQEMETAVKMACKVLKPYNISKAQFMEAEDELERAERAGASIVSIKPARESSIVRYQGWVQDLKNAMSVFFDCSGMVHQNKNRIRHTFYGISENTVATARAFEMTHNLIQDWAVAKTGIDTCNSYSVGVANGLYQAADEEARLADAEARKNEQTMKQAKQQEEELERQQEVDRHNHLMQPTVFEEIEMEKKMEVDFDEATTSSEHEEGVQYTFLTVNAKYASAILDEDIEPIEEVTNAASYDGRHLADFYEDEKATMEVDPPTSLNTTDCSLNVPGSWAEDESPLYQISMQLAEPQLPVFCPHSKITEYEFCSNMPGSWVEDAKPHQEVGDISKSSACIIQNQVSRLEAVCSDNGPKPHTLKSIIKTSAVGDSKTKLVTSKLIAKDLIDLMCTEHRDMKVHPNTMTPTPGTKPSVDICSL